MTSSTTFAAAPRRLLLATLVAFVAALALTGARAEADTTTCTTACARVTATRSR